jgi:hypothetical protein
MKALKHLLSLILLLPALAIAAAGDYVDRSGTITLGGTSQTLVAANPNRGNITVYNLSTESEVLCVNATSAASCSAAGSWHIAPGGALTLTTKELLTVVAATTGHKFTAKENVLEGFALVNPGSSTGGGGAGDASAANQATQITAEQAIQASAASIDTKVTGVATAANQTTANASLSVMDDWDESDRAKVNIVVGQAGITAGAGAVAANTPRVTLASDDPLLAKFGTVVASSTATSTLPTAGPDSGAVSGTATSAATLFTADLTGYESISLQVTSAGSATITYEQSEDQTTWFLVPGFSTTQTSGSAFALNTSSTGATTYAFPRRHRYFRARVSSYSSGTVTVVGHMSKVPLHTLFYVGASVRGDAGNSAARSGNPIAVAGRVRTTNDATLVADDTADIVMASNGSATVKLYSVPDLDWSYAAAASGIVNTTTAVTFKAADATHRNYVTAIDLMCEALGTATEVAIRDGAGGTVLWRTKVGTGGLTDGRHIRFPNPLRGTAATLLEVVTLTASGTGACYFNATGYVAP